jgi:hypothetical protein
MSRLSDKDVFNLLAKKLSGEISPQEDRTLKEMIETSDQSKSALNNAHHIWSTNFFSDNSVELISQKDNNEKI